MPATTYPQGVTFGAALVGGGLVSVPNGQGNVYYVDPANGNDGNFGTSPGIGSGGDGALKTIAKALALCTNGQGDTIFVMGSPNGSAENLVVTKDFVSIIGCQVPGYAKPDVVPVAGIPLTVSAQGFYTRHMRYAAVAADCVLQNGNGAIFDDCVFDGDGTANKAGIRFLPATLNGSATHYTASECKVQNSLFRGCAFGILFDSAAAAPQPGVGSTDNLVQNNRFYSNTVDIATANTGVTGLYSAQLLDILNNVFADKNKAVYIDFVTNIAGAAALQTGVIAGNAFNSATLTNVLVKINGTGFGAPGNTYQVGIKDASAF